MTWRNPSGYCLENWRQRRAPGDIIRSTDASKGKRRVREDFVSGQRWLVLKSVYQPVVWRATPEVRKAVGGCKAGSLGNTERD